MTSKTKVKSMTLSNVLALISIAAAIIIAMVQYLLSKEVNRAVTKIEDIQLQVNSINTQIGEINTKIVNSGTGIMNSKTGNIVGNTITGGGSK